MSTNEAIGTIIIALVPLIASVIALVKPIINLNNAITKLNVTIEQLNKETTEVHDTVVGHTTQIADHEKRIYFLEQKEK